jgi:MFS family permease
MGLIFACWATRIPDIQASLKLNNAELGVALFGAPLGQLPCMLLSGLLVDRFGSRKVMALGVLLNTCSLVALGLAGSFRQLFLALMLFGIGGNLFDIALNTQAVALERLRGRSIIGSLHGLWSLGSVAAGLLGVTLAKLQVGPAAHFTGVALFAFGLFLFLRPKLLGEDESRFEPPAKTEKHRRGRPDLLILLLGLVAFGSMATEGVMFDWIAVYFTSEVQAPAELVYIGYVACMTCAVLGRFTADRMITRHGHIRVLQAGGGLMGLGLLLLIVQSGLLLSILGSALIGLGMSAGLPICFSLAAKSKSVPPSVGISLVVFISFSGFMICPPLIGYLSHLFNLRLALIPVACMAAMILPLAPLLRKLSRKQA